MPFTGDVPARPSHQAFWFYVHDAPHRRQKILVFRAFSRLGLPVSESFPEPPVGGQTFVDFSVLPLVIEVYQKLARFVTLPAAVLRCAWNSTLGRFLNSPAASLPPKPSAMGGALRRILVVVIVKLSNPSWLNLQQKFDQTKTA
jgi:hypothetical protein